jgi:hypothetical protein
MHTLLTAALAACLLAITNGALHAGTADRGSQAAVTSAAKPSPQEAGLRYGQAMGVARACDGLRTTGAAEQLGRTFQGTDGALFRAEARRILASWQDALSCKKAGGPNECRLIFELSCRDAYREIGPEGSRFPGLLERMN